MASPPFFEFSLVYASVSPSRQADQRRRRTSSFRARPRHVLLRAPWGSVWWPPSWNSTKTRRERMVQIGAKSRPTGSRKRAIAAAVLLLLIIGCLIYIAAGLWSRVIYGTTASITATSDRDEPPPSRVLLNTAGTQPKKKSVNVVVSRFSEDVSWIGRNCLDDIPGHRPAMFHIVSKRGGKPFRNITAIKAMCKGRVVLRTIPNVGLEAATVLRHVLSNYHKLADLTMFLSGDEPAEGWAGHRRAKKGSHFWRNVRLRDYIAQGPLWVPTCMRSSDHVLIHFRKGYMKDKAKYNYSQYNVSAHPQEFRHGAFGEGGRRWSRCSSGGSWGWRPWIRDRWPVAVPRST